MALDTGAIKRGLRSVFDGNSTFMDGHQIVRTRTVSRKRTVPDWATDDKAVRALLLRSFPRLSSADGLQRRRAGRWMRVIQLYFRAKKSRREVADEMGEPENVVRMLIRAIKLAQSGRRANGSGRRTGSDTIQTPCGGANRDLLGTIKPDVRSTVTGFAPTVC